MSLQGSVAPDVVRSPNEVVTVRKVPEHVLGRTVGQFPLSMPKDPPTQSYTVTFDSVRPVLLLFVTVPPTATWTSSTGGVPTGTRVAPGVQLFEMVMPVDKVTELQVATLESALAVPPPAPPITAWI